MTRPASGTARRLAAIMFADVVGFTRMIGADEAATLATLRARRTEVIGPVVAAHGGRVVKDMGDGFLSEFSSAVNAVAAALALQAATAEADAALPPDQRMPLRIGINLGDILGEGDDIFGEGVNIAARLEPLAEPGGICVSAKVRDEVQGKLAATFGSMGAQALKNVALPVEAFRVTAGTAPVAPIPTASDRLSVAVLPFTAMGDSTADQHFGDGLTEDILTELSRVPFLHVAARNPSFRFRGPDADIAAAARTLGVRYVIEGSVRRMGPRLRISAQLIDTATGAHLWAERYDRPAEGIHDVQDEVVRGIATTTASRLRIAGADIARRKPDGRRTAQDLMLLAEDASWASLDGRQAAGALARQALELDPNAARAHGMLAYILTLDWLDDFDLPDNTLDAALDHARSAVALEPGDYNSHESAAYVCLFRRAFDLAEVHIDRASRLSPDQPGVLGVASLVALYSGRPAEAESLIESARRLDANFAPSWYWSNILLIRYVARDDAGVIDAFGRLSAPRVFTHAFAAAAHANLGDEANARAQAAATLALCPQFTVTAELKRDPFRHDADRDHLRDGMLRAGLPLQA